VQAPGKRRPSKSLFWAANLPQALSASLLPRSPVVPTRLATASSPQGKENLCATQEEVQHDAVTRSQPSVYSTTTIVGAHSLFLHVCNSKTTLKTPVRWLRCTTPLLHHHNQEHHCSTTSHPQKSHDPQIPPGVRSQRWRQVAASHNGEIPITVPHQNRTPLEAWKTPSRAQRSALRHVAHWPVAQRNCLRPVHQVVALTTCAT
jgi:hypothetical protein